MMKLINGKVFCTVMLTLCLLVPPCYGQTSDERIEQLMKIKPHQIKLFDPDSLKPNQRVLRMDFAEARILKPKDAAFLQNTIVQKIELVYTDFQSTSIFSQPVLNRKRLKTLYNLASKPFHNNMVEWSFLAQTSCRTQREAKKLFHGFIITYRPAATMRMITEEISSIKKIMSSIPFEEDFVETEFIPKVKRKRIPTGMYYPKSRAKRKRGVLYAKKSIWNRRQKYLTEYDTTYKESHIIHYKLPDTKRSYLSFVLTDSTIFKVLERKKEWKDILFVCDVTGSMSPYSAQMLVWHKLNFATNRARFYTFFNDGNNKPSFQKRIGKTGGIYSIEGDTYEKVEKAMYYTMSRGSGGDAPENDIEALLKAIKSHENVKEIVLIADNWSTIKDIELVSHLNKPVHIILCGADRGLLNIDYLNLARNTGGTVHTVEQDMENLMELNEGETLRFGKQTFIIHNGKFKPVFKS